MAGDCRILELVVGIEPFSPGDLGLISRAESFRDKLCAERKDFILKGACQHSIYILLLCATRSKIRQERGFNLLGTYLI
jgi:hypothetical protein